MSAGYASPFGVVNVQVGAELEFDEELRLYHLGSVAFWVYGRELDISGYSFTRNRAVGSHDIWGCLATEIARSRGTKIL